MSQSRRPSAGSVCLREEKERAQGKVDQQILPRPGPENRSSTLRSAGRPSHLLLFLSLFYPAIQPVLHSGNCFHSSRKAFLMMIVHAIIFLFPADVLFCSCLHRLDSLLLQCLHRHHHQGGFCCVTLPLTALFSGGLSIIQTWSRNSCLTHRHSHVCQANDVPSRPSTTAAAFLPHSSRRAECQSGLSESASLHSRTQQLSYNSQPYCESVCERDKLRVRFLTCPHLDSAHVSPILQIIKPFPSRQALS